MKTTTPQGANRNREMKFAAANNNWNDDWDDPGRPAAPSVPRKGTWIETVLA
jgi:hypothetical protein